MPISSFYGLQTSLRGLLAQQRLLDTTGHNIANASTQGYSRQEASLVAAPALEIPAGGIAGGAGAHLGSGVDVQAFRRIRDQFIDLQYRGQNTNLGEWKARATSLSQAEGSLSEPGENGINQQLTSSGTRGRTSPTPTATTSTRPSRPSSRRARRWPTPSTTSARRSTSSRR